LMFRNQKILNEYIFKKPRMMIHYYDEF